MGTTLNSSPGLVPGEPIWIDDPSVAAGRRLNRNAFTLLPRGERGNLGRDALKGFGMSQVDFSLRRQFTLSEGASLQFRAEFFNILNHPNFSNPDSSLLSGTFGTTINMLGRSLGSGGAGGGLNPLYQVGGPRSIQFALKIIF